MQGKGEFKCSDMLIQFLCYEYKGDMQNICSFKI